MGNNQLTGVIYSILVEKTKGTLLRNWDDLDLWMLAESVEGSVSQTSIELNENQQIVLDWLKAVYRENDIDSFTTILDLLRPTTLEDEQDSAYAALSRLKEADQFQVLAAFAEWGMKQ